MTLILGGTGQVGSSFRKLLPGAAHPAREELDVTDSDRLGDYLDKVAPDRIINCSGFTDVDGAEDNEATAMAVNAWAVGELARQADRRGIPLVTFSSDYVFDGHTDRPYVESSSTNPINAYGRSKEAGERLALRYPGSLVIRTSWLFSSSHSNFVATILRVASSGKPLRVVDDQFGSPTHVDDLTAATVRAAELGVSGVLHLASGPTTSWHQLARAALIAAELDPQLAQPCATDDYPVRATRPHQSSLSSERATQNGEESMPDWTVALPETARALIRRESKASTTSDGQFRKI